MGIRELLTGSDNMFGGDLQGISIRFRASNSTPTVSDSIS